MTTNLVILVGRIGQTPTGRETQSGKTVANFTVATSRPKRDAEGKTMKDASGYRIEDTEWHRITAFNGLGKSVASYAKKGQLVQVTGRLHYSQWKDDKGETRYGTEIYADEVNFLSRAKDSDDQGAPAGDDID